MWEVWFSNTASYEFYVFIILAFSQCFHLNSKKIYTQGKNKLYQYNSNIHQHVVTFYLFSGKTQWRWSKKRPKPVGEHKHNIRHVEFYHCAFVGLVRKGQSQYASASFGNSFISVLETFVKLSSLHQQQFEWKDYFP